MNDEARNTIRRIIERIEDPTKLYSLFESAVKAEREACAKIAETEAWLVRNESMQAQQTAETIAAEIRRR